MYLRNSSSLILSSASSGTMFGTKTPLRLLVMAPNPPITCYLKFLDKHFANHARRATIDKALFAAGVLIYELLVIDAKLMKHRGLIIVRRDDIFHCLVAKLVGLAEGHSAAEAPAGEPD